MSNSHPNSIVVVAPDAPDPLDVLGTEQPTPTATGNTTNKNTVFKDVNGDTWIVDSNGDAIKTGSTPDVDLTVVQPTPAGTGNTTNLNKFVQDEFGDTYYIDANGDSILIQEKDAGECKGTHFEQDVLLSAGAPLTLTHNFDMGNPREIGYSVTGVDGATVGDWPTGVRFINNTANTVDVVADTGSGTVDIMMFNHSCLNWVKRGAALKTVAPSLSYPTPRTGTANVAIAPIRPSVSLNGCTGSKVFSITPALPAGLTMSTTTGIITGTPTTATAAQDYLITVTSGGCSATATLNLGVQAVVTAPSGLSIIPASQSFPVGVPITTITPSLANNGGAPVTWGISPALPAGLTFNPLTGAISGTPTAVSAVTSYTITATNSAGSVSASLNLDVYAALSNWVVLTGLSGSQALGSGITSTTTLSGSPNLPTEATAPQYRLRVNGPNSDANSCTITKTLSAPLKNLRLTLADVSSPAGAEKLQVLFDDVAYTITPAEKTGGIQVVAPGVVTYSTSATGVVTINYPAGFTKAQVRVFGNTVTYSIRAIIEVK